MSTRGKVAWLGFTYALFTCAQNPSPASSASQVIVTVGHHYGHPPQALTVNDLTISQQYNPLAVSNLIPLWGDRAGLELFLLVDNCSSCEPGSKFEELRRFIGSQPSTTSVGVGYIQNGRLEVVERPTQDRERAIKALRTPAGSNPSNPFGVLTELIKGWQENTTRHALLMISNGIDPAAPDPLHDTSVEAAIEAAQRARVIVYTIYHPSADYLTSDYSKISFGQIQLAHLAVDTGGEAYFTGFGPLPSLAPFLADLADHLANQYLLEFHTNSSPPGTLQQVTIKSRIPDVELMVPDRVSVPGH
jgi:hypothetical protein